ncbi:MAG: hypothetical protein ACD_19C00277G0005 [uncultured bacterium]|nr:MAG: hypothetical protein ACD_19C00277G0005 [uncultured bacterium]
MEFTTQAQIQFEWDNPNRKELVELKIKYDLDKVVETGKDNFEKILLLKEWVYKTLPHGNNPIKNYQNATQILDDATSGQGEFYCSHYAQVFIECANALGFKARKVGVDNNHELGEEEMHHGIADVWDSVHNKWVVIDAQHNLHFEKVGIPLNALEVRNEFIGNGAKDIEGVVGVNEKRIKYDGSETGFDTPSNYYWFFVYTDNGPNMWQSPTILFIDQVNEGKTWYRGGKNKGEFKPHPMYEGQFVKITNSEIVFPVLRSNDKT